MQINHVMNTTNLTPQEKYDLLTKDFLERDGEHFVRIRKSDRLGWEDELPKDSAYSAVILNPKSDRELLKNAAQLARQMVTSMDPPYKVNVKIDASANFTDTRSLFVATKVLDDTSLPLGRRLDTFLGLAVHEGSHLLYTDFEYATKAGITNKVLHDLHNIIEDEMIERKLGERKPGLANFLKATKYYYFGKYDEVEKPKDKLSQLFNAILITVRYPAALTREMIDEFADELIQVREILAQFPENTQETIEKAKEIFEILRKYATEQKKMDGQQQDDNSQEQQGSNSEKDQEQSPSSDNNQDQDDETESESDTETEPEPDSKSENGQNENEQEKDSPENKERSQQKNTDGNDRKTPDNGNSEDSEEDSQDSGQEGNDSDSNPSPNESDSISDEELEDLLQEIAKAAEELTQKPSADPSNTPNQNDMAKEARKNKCLIAKECDGELEIGETHRMLILHQQDNKAKYQASYQRIKRYIPATAAALKQKSTNYTYNLTGLRSGLLDMNKLTEARQGVQTVYTKKGKVQCDDINVVLVIDESGSMNGTGERLAMDTAVLINEAIGSVHNVTLNIYGYSNSREYNELYPYRENNKADHHYSLGSICARGGTPTANAIAETAIRVRKTSANKTLMFIVSDGGANGGTSEVRKITGKIRKQGFTVIGISIDSQLTEDELKAMYDHYIVMDDISDLAQNLAKTVKNAILKNTKRNNI